MTPSGGIAADSEEVGSGGARSGAAGWGLFSEVWAKEENPALQLTIVLTLYQAPAAGASLQKNAAWDIFPPSMKSAPPGTRVSADRRGWFAD